HFDTDFGPMCVVMVGALLVSGVETVWNGVEIPAYASRPVRRDWRGHGVSLQRFAEMARFNYGSTVIMLFPREALALEALPTETVTRLGGRLGTLLRRRPQAENGRAWGGARWAPTSTRSAFSRPSSTPAAIGPTGSAAT